MLLQSLCRRKGSRQFTAEATSDSTKAQLIVCSFDFGVHPSSSMRADNACAIRGEASAQNQTPPLEDRVKKLEGKVLSIGPFRFSGDFRLRFDGIFRKADATPPAGFTPLTHQQNARMRYRLRFNFDTDVNPRVSFHAQLPTG